MAVSSENGGQAVDPHAAEREALFAEMWAAEDAATGGLWDAVLAKRVEAIEKRLDVIGRG